MRRLTLTEWLVLVVALVAANYGLYRIDVGIRAVKARHAATIARAALAVRTEECLQHVDWYVAAGALEENERTAATASCVSCTGSLADSHVCRYWLDRLDGHP